MKLLHLWISSLHWMRLILFHLSHPAIAIAFPIEKSTVIMAFLVWVKRLPQKVTSYSHGICKWQCWQGKTYKISYEWYHRESLNLRVSHGVYFLGYLDAFLPFYPYMNSQLSQFLKSLWLSNNIGTKCCGIQSVLLTCFFLKNKDKRGKQIVHSMSIIQIAGNNSCNVPF